MGDLIFFLAISSLLLHEMDAIDKKEWRLLFVLRKLPDEGALRWFILLHLPLLVALLALVAAEPSTATRSIEGGVDVFLIGHAVLHEILSVRGDSSFASTFSRVLIWSAGLFAALHLLYLVVQ
ncbi:MAG: hypothetical protein GY722_01630 [bacterium]|nr:hypothetical protein [bacterium]